MKIFDKINQELDKIEVKKIVDSTFETTKEFFEKEEVKSFTDKTLDASMKMKDYTSSKLHEGYNYTHDKAIEAIEDYKSSKEEVNESNWYKKASVALEDVNDSFMRENNGTSAKVTKSVVGKLGAAGTSVGIFSIASIIGTAGTGTAIGTLSGAAFTSASLAWLGGSMMMGSIIVGVASIAGGIGAVLGAGWVFKKYVYGKKRERSELELKEQNIIDVCLSLAATFRQKEKDREPLDPVVARAMYHDALKPLCEQLLDQRLEDESWTSYAKNRYKNSLGKLLDIANFSKEYSSKNPNFTTGIFSAVLLQLFSGDNLEFNGDEVLVLESLRRSNISLSNASIEELSAYVQAKDASQLAGLTNNIKGIYHEKKFAQMENNDGDMYQVELFEDTNHAGADVIIRNIITGETREVQLKATDYLSYVQKHNSRYENIEVFATSEVASKSEDISSTGISNDVLTEDVKDVFEKLDEGSQSNLSSSMTVAALVALARNSKVLLAGEKLSQSEKERIVKEGTIAAGTAGLVSLILG